MATLDKYEYKVRTDEMKQLVREAKFAEAMEIADSIDWRRVKNTKMLCTVSDIYKINRKFEESKEVLLMAYEKNPASRSIVHSLCELCIKTDDVVQANEFLKEFIRLAPKDNNRYILRYKMLEAQDVSLEERISVLEEYKNREPLSEKWAYELAYLYHRVGLVTRCIEECDQLFLWFGEGKYVLKALELKQLHVPLTSEQQYVYDRQFYQTHRTHTPTTAYDGYEEETAPKEEEIEVPTMDVSEYNTINLQRELAESMKEIMPDEDTETDSKVEEVLFSDTNAEAPPIFEDPFVYQEPIDLTQTPEVLLEEEPEEVLEEEPVEEEVSEIAEEEIVFEDITEESVEDIANQVTKVYKAITDDMIRQATQPIPPVEEKEQPKVTVITPETGDMAEIGVSKEEKLQQGMTGKLPADMAKMLSQEYDGQIRLVVPETEKVEKQITGQLNIIDVMAEWERIKKEAEEKRAAEVRKHVLDYTGNLFIEFDEASNNTDIFKEMELLLAKENEEDAEATETVEENENSTDTEEIAENIEETEEILFEVPEEETDEDEVEPEDDIFEEELEPEEDIIEEEVEPEEDIIEEEVESEEDIIEEDAEPEEDIFEEEIIEDDAEPEDEEEEDEKENTSMRTFTSEEKMLFSSFIQTKKDKKKLMAALDEMSLAAYTGNVVITGEEVADTTTLAKAMIKSMQVSDSNFSGKVAKITGTGLDNKDIKEVLAKLENGALIVEKAHKMSEQAAEKLYKALEREGKGIVVIIEGPKSSMNEFMDKNVNLSKVFTARFDITGFSNQALVDFARRYAKDQEYAMDELAELALHSRIEKMQTKDHKVTVDEVKEIVDGAIAKANKKNLKHFFDVLCSNRYDEEDMIILREKDFET